MSSAPERRLRWLKCQCFMGIQVVMIGGAENSRVTDRIVGEPARSRGAQIAQRSRPGRHGCVQPESRRPLERVRKARKSDLSKAGPGGE